MVSPVPERTPGRLIPINLSSEPVTLAAAIAFTSQCSKTGYGVWLDAYWFK